MKMKLLGCLLSVALLFHFFNDIDVFAHEIKWDKKYYNPNENSDGLDFILPLPAGGAITFRPVVIVQDKIIEARVFSLGNQRFIPNEYPIDGSISGIFELGKEKARLFYIGKYEITRSQYDAVMSGNIGQQLTGQPKVGASWFEAVQFCDALTLWLLKHHKNLLPVDDKIPGYIRLPTEEEWEFACRGGDVVSPNFFYRDSFIPDVEDPADYVQYYRSGDVEEIQSIGRTKKANPLGLYDMLGNAGEMCFNLFRLNYNYGRSGGFVVKGGHFKLLEPVNIRSSIRQEKPFYNSEENEPYVEPFQGFRVIVAAPLYTSLPRGKIIRDQWNADSLPSGDKLRISFAEAYQKLNFVYDRIENRELKHELGIIKTSYDEIAREINEIELEDAMSFFRIGAYCADIVARQDEKLRAQETYLEKWRHEPNTEKSHISKMEKNVQDLKKAIELDLESYGDAITSLNGKYRNNPDLVISACNRTIEKKKLEKRANQITAVKLVLQHVKGFSQRDEVIWRKDIIKFLQEK